MSFPRPLPPPANERYLFCGCESGFWLNSFENFEAPHASFTAFFGSLDPKWQAHSFEGHIPWHDCGPRFPIQQFESCFTVPLWDHLDHLGVIDIRAFINGSTKWIRCFAFPRSLKDKVLDALTQGMEHELKLIRGKDPGPKFGCYRRLGRLRSIHDAISALRD